VIALVPGVTLADPTAETIGKLPPFALAPQQRRRPSAPRHKKAQPPKKLRNPPRPRPTTSVTARKDEA